ncbi:MAG: GSCFA domain-containing protein [Rhodothermaceae bacterium]
MNFRTEINLPPAKNQITYKDKILTFGSCFAENIANKLTASKFDVYSNPFGVLYNPVSILNSVKLLVSGKRFSESDLIFDQEEYHSFFHHSDFSHHDKDVVLKRINSSLDKTESYLKDVSFVTITLGTAWIYLYKENGATVSNCHKIPAKMFERKRLSVQETASALSEIIALLRSKNPELKIIFTVSPIRHWKDGAVENQISKSTLLMGIQEVKEENVIYFPSYEIMMDDLRDYRFYEKDMLHPSVQAVDYIWEKFRSVFFDENTLQIMKSVEKIVNAFNHRPRNPESEKHQMFVKKNIELINQLVHNYPEINFREELTYFNDLLK